MKKFNYIVAVLLFSSLSFFSYGQEGRLKYANKMYDQKSYYFASEGYEDVLARKTDSATVAVRLADSYDKIGNTAKAADWYNYLKRNDQLTKEQHLRLALLQRQLGNYTTSETLFSEYTSKYGENDVASNVLNAGTSIDNLTEDRGWFKVKSQDVNSKFSEIGVSYLDENTVLLASSKRRNWVYGRVDTWSGEYLYNTYRAPIDAEGMIGKTKRMKSDAKTKMHDGPATYDAKTGYVYFTRNNFIDGKRGFDGERTSRLKIYRAKLDGNKYRDAEELSINGDDFSTAHPTVSKDGKRLYFSSDRPGGFGGMDIYFVNLNNNGLPTGDVVNLGDKVNTTEDEVFPFYNTGEDILFFSSEGHFGLGGLDIYASKIDKNGNAKSIENLGAPVNSPYDDFSFMNNVAQTKGYFTSNRPGGAGGDDIYGFDQLEVIRNGAVLRGNTKDLLTEADLEGASVYLVNKAGERIAKVDTEADGNFEFSLIDIEDDFELVAEKDNYVAATKSVSYDESKDEYTEDLNLMPILNYHYAVTVRDMDSKELLDDVSVRIVDNKKNEDFETHSTVEGAYTSGTLPYDYKDQTSYSFRFEKKGYVSTTLNVSDILNLEEVINVSANMKKIEEGKTDLNDVVDIAPIYFDLNKFDIRPDAAKELDKIVEIMNDNPGMVIELGSHTDSRGSAAYNRNLSDKRAKASANYVISRGIDKSRISGKGYGMSRLKISNAEINKATTEEEKEALHEQNRRTEFIIVRMK